MHRLHPAIVTAQAQESMSQQIAVNDI